MILVGTAGADPAVPDASRPPTTRPDSAPSTPAPPATGDATATGDGTTATTAPAVPSPMVVYVAGDSVAWSIGTGMQEVAEELDVFVDNRGLFGCGLFTGDGPVDVGGRRAEEIEAPVETDECRTKPTTNWPPQLAALQPDVALLMVGAWDAFDHQLDGEVVSACDPAFADRYRAHLREAIQVLGSTGARVVVLDPPYLRYEEGEFGPDRAEIDRRVDCLRTYTAQAVAEAPDATLVDLMPWVCPTADTCVTEVDGETLRPDGIHYDDPGGAVIARWLVPQLRAVLAGDP
jgi:lysophospholipase L1-like esterase